MSDLQKKPPFMQKLALGKLTRMLLGIAIICSGLFIVIYNLVIKSNNKPSDVTNSGQVAQLNSANTDVSNDGTVKQIEASLKNGSFKPNQPQQINAPAPSSPDLSKMSPDQLRAYYKNQSDNEMVKVATIPDYSKGGANPIPPIQQQNPGNAVANQNNQYQEQRAQERVQAQKAATKVNISVQSSTTTSSTPTAPQIAPANPAMPSNPALAKLNASDGKLYQPATDKSGFYVNTGGNDSSKDLIATHQATPFRLKAGTYIPAIMQSGINSDTPGAIVGRVRQNVYDTATGKYLIIPKGSTLLGSYSTNVQYGQERVICAWNKLIYPNADEVQLQGQPGTDMAGYAGLNDQVNNHYWTLFGDAFILSVISAGMQYNQQQFSNNMNGGQSYGSALSQSAGQQMGQVSTQVIQKGLNVQPTLIIRSGMTFNILLTQDLSVNSPYRVRVYPGD